MGRFGVLHFATHALVDEVLPLRSALALGAGSGEDGWLEAGEIYPMTLSAGLVVLSGCQTSRGQTLSGEGVLSLARAFLYAGSQSVVATLWAIDDRGTELLMQHFYGRLAASGRPDEALFLAKRAAIAAGVAPRVWAAFVPIGHLHNGLVVTHSWTPRRVLAFGFGLIAVLAAAVAAAASLCQRLQTSGANGGNRWSASTPPANVVRSALIRPPASA